MIEDGSGFSEHHVSGLELGQRQLGLLEFLLLGQVFSLGGDGSQLSFLVVP